MQDKARQIGELVAAGDRIGAIRLLREMTGMGLADARDIIESVAAGKPLPPLTAQRVAAAAADSGALDLPVHARLVHDVYFTLKESSREARQALVAECYAKLASIDGVVLLAAGTRDPELVRDVNDRDYDVSLHVFFRDRAAHDAYQEAPGHLQFVEANHDNWQSVRVFDSNINDR